MPGRLLMSLILGLGVIIAASLIGCSSDTITKVSPVGSDNNNSAASSVTYYFPLTEGYSTVYDLVNGDGTKETITYTVGKEVVRTDGIAHEWLSYSRAHGYDTGYFQATATCLNYFESLASSAEKILQLPLTPGQSWTRLSASDLLTNHNETDIVFDNNNDQPDTSTTGNGLAKNYPTDGMSTMTVAAIEGVELSSGGFYSSAVKITNANNSGTYNLYWFAPGVGLIKWVLGAPSLAASTGSVVGELRSYGLN